MKIESSLSHIEVQEICRACFPEFTWKIGFSEYQGDYVSGRQNTVGGIQCWSGENPMEFSISLLPDVSEVECARLIYIALEIMAPRIGKIVTYKER